MVAVSVIKTLWPNHIKFFCEMNVKKPLRVKTFQWLFGQKCEKRKGNQLKEIFIITKNMKKLRKNKVYGFQGGQLEINILLWIYIFFKDCRIWQKYFLS